MTVFHCSGWNKVGREGIQISNSREKKGNCESVDNRSIKFNERDGNFMYRDTSLFCIEIYNNYWKGRRKLSCVSLHVKIILFLHHL